MNAHNHHHIRPEQYALYHARIIEAAEALNAQCRLEAPHVTTEASSPLCGSTIIVDLILQGDQISAWGCRLRACLLGQASTELYRRCAIGLDDQASQAALHAMLALLAGDSQAMTRFAATVPPAAHIKAGWQDFVMFAPACNHPSRHGSILLPFRATKQALAKPPATSSLT